MDSKRRCKILGFIAALAVGATAGLSWLVLALGGMRLEGAPALAVCVLTETGSVRLVGVVLLLAVLLWGTDAGLGRARRRKDAAVALALLALALPALASFNEFIVKPAFHVARPSHVRLAATGILPDLEAFYRLDRSKRQDFLRSRLPGGSSGAGGTALATHPVVLEHWIRESGHSFPSGHAFNAFTVAVLALGLAVAAPTRRRTWVAVVLLVWAAAVALSRVVLLLHRPTDVAVAALAGAVCGVLLLWPWWKWTRGGRSDPVEARAGARGFRA